ncbi:MAG: peptidase U32 family protein [Erysipelotrichaceae bacterium]
MHLLLNLQDESHLTHYKQHQVTGVIVSLAHHGVRGGKAFALASIPALVKTIHEAGLQAYLLMNKIYVEDELDDLRSTLAALQNVPLDGIYFGDLGLAYEASLLNMSEKLIYNPDTLITNSQDVSFYLDAGFQLVTLSKEITYDSMQQIAQKNPGRVEVIIHGRLNMMHSKRPLLTNYDAFLNHELHLEHYSDLTLMEENRDERMPIIEDEFGTHVFTGFSLASFKEINGLLASGVDHVRIENQFMTLEEQLETIDAYHQVINKEVDGQVMFERFVERYPHHAYTDGFMYKETATTK